MKFKVLAVMVCAAFIFCGFAFAAQQGASKVAVINLQKVLRESKAGQQAKAVFGKDLEGKRAILQEKEKAVMQIESDLRTKRTQMKPADLKAKQDAYEKDVKELKRLKTDLEDELKKKDSELAAKILRDIYDVTKKIGAEQGYTLIIQGNQQIMYLDQAADITDEVIKRYDNQAR